MLIITVCLVVTTKLALNYAIYCNYIGLCDIYIVANSLIKHLIPSLIMYSLNNCISKSGIDELSI